MRALGYVRVSRVGKRKGDSFLSPELQRGSIARVCQREGLELVEVLEELDRSGGDAARPLWNDAIARIERGEVAALVVWNLDRFSRSLVDALDARRALLGVQAAACRLDPIDRLKPSSVRHQREPNAIPLAPFFPRSRHRGHAPRLQWSAFAYTSSHEQSDRQDPPLAPPR